MLKRLIIQNYVIIPMLDIAFRPGLTIITGETGAGKSILLGALGLALGKRGEAKVVTEQAEKCTVEAHFELQDDYLRPLFEKHELDYDRHLICRREITQNGRSRSFINDTPVSLKILAEITGNLLELHHQHDNLALQTQDYQITLLDTISGSSAIASAYSTQFATWNRLKRELVKVKTEEHTAARKTEFLQFQLNELRQAKLTAGEVTKLEESQSLLEHAETIDHVIQELQHSLQVGQHGILPQLTYLIKQIESIAPYFPSISEIQTRIHASRLELEDLALETNRLSGPGGSDPGKLAQVQNRLNQLYSLIKKYQVKDEEGLIQLLKELEDELKTLSSGKETIEELEKQISIAHENVAKKAAELTSKRKAGAKKLIPQVDSLLKELGMPNARFDIDFQSLPEPGNHGGDDVQFIFSANKGTNLQPIQSVASGGELSRLSLALKTIYAGQAHLPSIVFDEIDTGISGEVAWRMGQLILGMSTGHQILMITHSPQIAAHAQQQFHVSKKSAGEKDISHIEPLPANQRIQEIAKMLSGDPPSKEAVKNAQSLIQAAGKK